jgi:hypothetical protein
VTHARTVLRIALFSIALVFGLTSLAKAASDPRLSWWTIETEHFRVHYYRGLEPVAERIAVVAESANRRLEQALGTRMAEVTNIVLNDFTDDANGSATAIPYNAIRLYVTAPDDLSPLGDYDDWYLSLVTHEHTHILHTDTIRGAPALVNAIVGKWLAPNQVQPRWILEGLAVFDESRFTGGGRNRSSIFDMFMRADVLDGRVMSLDEMSNNVHRWPQGNVWYLYGSRFVTWISDVYGPDVWKTVVNDYGAQLVPWGVNRSIRRATGRTYEELYPAWVSWLGRHYDEQILRAKERGGLREGTRLTHHGQTVAAPRFTQGGIVFYRDDAHSVTGLYRLPVSSPSSAREKDEQLVVRTAGRAVSTFEPGGGVVWSSPAVTSRVLVYSDLFRLHAGATDDGFGERERLTTGERAQEPDVSPDGKRIVFTKNHRGTTSLVIADRGADGSVGKMRVLVPSVPFDQAYTPRFSPDGRHVAYSAWTRGGYRDVRIVEVATGRYEEIFHDRATDWDPVFSADGRYVFFASDRALGIANIFAFDRTTRETWQVTNVKTGAFDPAVSPDGKWLAYVGYTSQGFDLYGLPLNQASWTPAPAYVDDRPAPPEDVETTVLSRHPYNPLPTLRPRSYTLDFAPGTFGSAFTVKTSAGDVVGHHNVSAAILVQTDRAEPQGVLGYSYGRLPFDMNMAAYRTISPFKYSDTQPLYIQNNVGVSTGVSYAVPSELDTNRVSLSYSITRYDGSIPLSRLPDPYAPIRGEPARGQLGTVSLGWAYSNADASVYAVGTAERGFTLSVNNSVSVPALASDHTLYVASLSATDYVPMPWAAHHTLALHAAGGISGGNYPNRGIYYIGGFSDQPWLQNYQVGPYQGSFVIRGYAPYAFYGAQYQLYNAEYRFPLFIIDRGLSTLPFFVSRIDGNFFADYGGAFDSLDLDRYKEQLHLGVGAELWVQLVLGYRMGVFVRVGYARGVKDGAAIDGGQTYVVLSTPY